MRTPILAWSGLTGPRSSRKVRLRAAALYPTQLDPWLEMLTWEVQCSAPLQHLTNTSSKVSNPPDQDRSTRLHRRKVPSKRSHHPLLRHFEAVPEQRCQLATDGTPCHQGVGQLRRGHNHGHKHNHEGHRWQHRHRLQTQRYQGSLPHY